MSAPVSSIEALKGLAAGADLFASFVDANPNCIMVLDIQGRLDFISPAGLALLEIDDFETVRGKPWSSLWPPASSPLVDEAVQAAARGEARTFQALAPTAKGARKWWDTVVSPVFGPGGSDPIRMLARCRDITEELKARSLLDTIVEFVPAALVAKDGETGRFVLVNRAAETLLGVSREKMIGKSDHDIFPKAQADFFQETDRRVMEADGVTLIDKEQMTNGAGEVRWLRTKKVGVESQGGARYLLAITEDITDARNTADALSEALERAQAANRAKSEFLTTMSHEIRTPLNGLLGMAQAMQAGRLDEMQQHRLKIIQRSGETLLAILNDILDISKIEAAALELECTDFDLEHMVRGAVANFAAEAEKKKLVFGLVIGSAARGFFNGDGARIRRLLYSLLSNAVKFTRAGEVRLTVDYGDAGLRLEVSDTGIGIADEQLPTLFDKFVQGDSSLTRHYGGSGLGLSIAQGLAQLMGGSIEVISTLGLGSVFSVTLPLTRITAPRPGELPAQAGAPEAANAAPLAVKVLAAEDNQVNRLVLQTLLQQAGIEPLMVDDGVQALAAWERESWDVILMDIQMPEMDGISATKAIRLREIATGRTRTPIIAVTANAMTHQLETYRAAGMDAVSPKPIDAAQLFAVLAQVLEANDPTHTDQAA